jgi:hypothetical protein
MKLLVPTFNFGVISSMFIITLIVSIAISYFMAVEFIGKSTVATLALGS